VTFVPRGFRTLHKRKIKLLNQLKVLRLLPVSFHHNPILPSLSAPLRSGDSLLLGPGKTNPFLYNRSLALRACSSLSKRVPTFTIGPDIWMGVARPPTVGGAPGDMFFLEALLGLRAWRDDVEVLIVDALLDDAR
jgi:hypothetical protein